MDYKHPDLASNIWTNPREIPGNGFDDDGNGYVDDYRGWNYYTFIDHTDPMDDNGHGTHVAGTIAAVGNNGVGVVGVTWKTKIMPVRFLGPNGKGSLGDAASAIVYAANMGAKVANNSWGSMSFSQVIEDAIAYANSKGMLVVFAAGNMYGLDNDKLPFYPCSSSQPNVICVAATDRNDQIASFSNYGATTVDLGAPGVDILSTVPTGDCRLCDPSGYRPLSGTSMATPYVSGAMALILAQSPLLTIGGLKDLMLASVDPIPSLMGITVTGGRLNVNSAFRGNHFKVGATLPSQTVQMGGFATFTVVIDSIGSFTPVTLTLSSRDQSIMGSFSVNPVTPRAGVSAASILTVSTTAFTTNGTHVLTIIGTDGLGESHTYSVILNVIGSDFSVSINPFFVLQTVEAGGSATYNVRVTSKNEFRAPVTLSMTATDPNIGGQFTISSVQPNPNKSVFSTLIVTTTAFVPLGEYILDIRASDGIRTRSTRAILHVVELPDLVVTEVSGPPSLSLDVENTIIISTTAKNQGKGVAGEFWVWLYLSEDQTITKQDIYLGARILVWLGAGAESSGRTELPIVLDIIDTSIISKTGTYYLGAIVNPPGTVGRVQERDYTNNTQVGNLITVYTSQLRYSSTIYGVKEGDGSATITVVRTGSTKTVASVQYATSNGTALSGSDYTATSGTLGFAAGEKTKTFSVPILDDKLLEASKTVNLTLSGPTERARLGSPNNATLTIIDDDRPPTPTVTLSVGSATIAETGGTTSVRATLNTVASLDVTVNLTKGGTATNGTDYTLAGTITIPAGALSASVAIASVSDTLDEGNEMVIITASCSGTCKIMTVRCGGTSCPGSTSQQTVKIIDDDRTPTVVLSVGRATIAESGGMTSVTATLSTDVASLDVTVNLTKGGTATNGTDYTLAGTITIPAGKLSASIALIAVSDMRNEPNETVIITASCVSTCKLGWPSRQAVTIINAN